MKSAERHKLETNWLAIHLDQWIEKVRPHSSTITGVAIAVAMLCVIWFYFSRTSATRQDDAWNAFNGVVSGSMDERSVTQLSRSAEEFSDTDMNPWARVTSADGQVWIASRTLLQDRAAANKALDDAAVSYRSVLGSSRDELLVNRARYGLARVLEMRNEPEKAREEYLQVTGAFAVAAERRAKELENQKTRKTLDWLAKAEAPRPTIPRGPGTPGQTPGLDVDDLKLPGATGLVDPSKSQLNIDDLFKGLGEMGKEGGTDRYGTGDAVKPGDVATLPADDKGAEKPAPIEMPKDSAEKK